MPRNRALLFLVFIALMLMPAQAAQPQITPAQARAAADEVIRLIEALYVFPERRAPIASALKASRDAGRYDVTSPHQLSERVNADLRAASNDGHLSLAFDPKDFEELRRPRTPLQRSPFVPEVGRLRNHGYEELKVLPGNVRYARISGFMWFEQSTPRIIDAAARFLADGDAVVIDLRGNGGGSAEAVQRIASYFFPGGGQELMRFHDGLSGRTNVNSVLSNLPAPRLHGKPLYTLIDAGSASAAEEFAYHVQQFNLGKLVGRTTAGAANNNQLYPVPPFFVASISVGRPEHPVSRTNWEGKGIAPHVESASAAALDRAHLLALQALAARAEPMRRRDYEWEIVAAEVRLKPYAVPPPQLDAYVGTYGMRRIWREGQTLIFQREKREPQALVPLGPDFFGLANSPAVRLRFHRRAGRVVAFDQLTKDGVIGTVERTPSG